jgi:ribose-phosphate pyrophosphokinase
VKDRDCIIVDDMIDTGGTLCKAAEALKEQGAKRVFAYATHPVFSGGAAENIANSVIDELIITDTIPLSAEMKAVAKVRRVGMSQSLSVGSEHSSNLEWGECNIKVRGWVCNCYINLSTHHIFTVLKTAQLLQKL